jgi:cytochrome c-type biogenesis protein CcmE
MNGEDFVASDVLLKCPSKYKDEEVYIKSEKGP